MTTVTKFFYKEGDHKSETGTINIINEETIKKETKTSLSKGNSKIIYNNTTENQYNFIEAEMLKFSPLKDASTMGKLKYYIKYIWSNYDDKLHDNFLKRFEYEIKEDGYSVIFCHWKKLKEKDE